MQSLRVPVPTEKACSARPAMFRADAFCRRDLNRAQHLTRKSLLLDILRLPLYSGDWATYHSPARPKEAPRVRKKFLPPVTTARSLLSVVAKAATNAMVRSRKRAGLLVCRLKPIPKEDSSKIPMMMPRCVEGSHSNCNPSDNVHTADPNIWREDA